MSNERERTGMQRRGRGPMGHGMQPGEKPKDLKGSLPNKQLRLILAWCTIHQDELMQNWELAKDMKPLNRINPLI